MKDKPEWTGGLDDLSSHEKEKYDLHREYGLSHEEALEAVRKTRVTRQKMREMTEGREDIDVD